MKKNTNVYLTDILRAVADVQTYTVDADKDDFWSDHMLQKDLPELVRVTQKILKELS